jgi:hypothetical protein
MEHIVIHIGATDSSSLQVIKFDTMDVKPHLPYHVAFQINVMYSKHIIGRTVVDEGASTCVCHYLVGNPLALLSSLYLPLFNFF